MAWLLGLRFLTAIASELAEPPSRMLVARRASGGKIAWLPGIFFRDEFHQ